MLREVQNNERVFCIKSHLGVKHFVVADNAEEVAVWCANKEKTGFLISSVTEICVDGTTPRVPIRSMAAYKKAKREA